MSDENYEKQYELLHKAIAWVDRRIEFENQYASMYAAISKENMQQMREILLNLINFHEAKFDSEIQKEIKKQHEESINQRIAD